MQGKDNIPIVLSADVNYIIPLIVTIGSILDSALNDTKYEIIVLADDKLDEQRILELAIRNNNVKFSIIRVNNELLRNAHIENEGLSFFTYCRLLVPQLLQGYKKCIYLDIDLVVLDDLKKLYDIDIEQFYVAGVKDYAIQDKRGESIKKILDIPSIDSYINAGVLLFNLAKIREDGIDKMFLEGIGQKWVFEDQDIINKYCYGKIGFLPLRYNVLYRYYQKIDYINKGFYSESESAEAQCYPAIIHYTGRDMKPWKYIRSRAAKRWWDVAERVLSIDVYNQMLRTAEDNMYKMSWDYILEKCRDREVVIWGFSDKGEALYDGLMNDGISILYFGDNDKEKYGKTYKGTRVINLNELLVIPCIKDCLFVISSQAAFVAIEKQLRQYGIKDIIRYFNKNEYYYMALDDEYFDIEKDEIIYKEKLQSNSWNEYLDKKYYTDKWIYYGKNE